LETPGRRTSAQDISIQAVWPESIPPGATASLIASALSVSAMVWGTGVCGSAGAALWQLFVAAFAQQAMKAEGAAQGELFRPSE
jgi:hypothetical protein